MSRTEVITVEVEGQAMAEADERRLQNVDLADGRGLTNRSRQGIAVAPNTELVDSPTSQTTSTEVGLATQRCNEGGSEETQKDGGRRVAVHLKSSQLPQAGRQMALGAEHHQAGMTGVGRGPPTPLARHTRV